MESRPLLLLLLLVLGLLAVPQYGAAESAVSRAELDVVVGRGRYEGLLGGGAARWGGGGTTAVEGGGRGRVVNKVKKQPAHTFGGQQATHGLL